MPNYYSGLPANVEANLPSPTNVQSTTHASPIALTTTADHGLQPGDYFVAVGTTYADGTWMAGSITNNTVVLLVPPAGTNSALPAGAGGAAGSIRSAGFGTRFPIVSDGDPPDAVTWAISYEALGDRTAWLEYITSFAMAALNGAVWVIQSGATVSAAAGSIFAGTWAWASSSMVKLIGRKVLLRPRVPLSDANHTIDVTQGDTFVPAAPAAPRTITAHHTTGTPVAGETMTVLFPLLPGTGLQFTVERVDHTVIAEVWGNPSIGGFDLGRAFVQLELVGGVWKMGINSGELTATDGVTPESYGVIPGAGA